MTMTLRTSTTLFLPLFCLVVACDDADDASEPELAPAAHVSRAFQTAQASGGSAIASSASLRALSKTELVDALSSDPTLRASAHAAIERQDFDIVTERSSDRVVRLVQTHDGIPMFGRELILRRGSDARLSYVSHFIDGTFDSQPVLASEDVEELALHRFAQVHGVAAATTSTELFYVERRALRGTPRHAQPHFERAFRVRIEAGSEGMEFWIDAVDGTVISERGLAHEIRDRETYDDPSSVLHKNEAGNVGGYQGDDSKIEVAHLHAGHAYDYYAATFQRDSYDDDGATIVSRVNATRTSWSGSLNYDNWAMSTAFSPEVVGHEFAHAVQGATTGFGIGVEGGALRESLADVFGKFLEFHIDGAIDNWVIADEVVGPWYTDGSLRSLSDPTYGRPFDPANSDLNRNQPDHNSLVVSAPAYPHINSGIPSKAMYLLVEGGTHYGVTLAGIGLDDAEQVLYEAITGYMTALSDFAVFRESMTAACTTATLSTVSIATCRDEVGLAFDAVGIDALEVTPHSEHPLFRVMLQGPYAGSSLMNDDLRSAGILPLSEPFTALGYTHVGSGGEAIDPVVLDDYGPNSIVDWIFVELRDSQTLAIDRTIVGLVQQDGDVVGIDGRVPPLISNTPNGAPYIVIRHRNHLGVMLSTPVRGDAHALYDLSDPNTRVVGPDSRILDGDAALLAAGDVNADGSIDAGDRSQVWNDRNTSGYLNSDTSLEGWVGAADRARVWNNRNRREAILTPPLDTTESDTLQLRAWLQGPANAVLMNDTLRIQNLLPTIEPYTAAGFVHVGGGGSEADEDTFNGVGPDAIVDWVVVELRDALDASVVLSTHSTLLQRDGDVVLMDGFTPFAFQGDAFVALHHRNHLSVMTAAPVNGSAAGVLDFSDAATVVYDDTARVSEQGRMCMLGADANGDGSVGADDRTQMWNLRNQVGYLGVDARLDGVADAGDRALAWTNRNRGTTLP